MEINRYFAYLKSDTHSSATIKATWNSNSKLQELNLICIKCALMKLAFNFPLKCFEAFGMRHDC